MIEILFKLISSFTKSFHPKKKFITKKVFSLPFVIESNTVWNCITYLMEGNLKSHHPIFFSNHIIFNSSQFTFDFCFPPFPTYFASTHPPSLFWLINNWVMLFVYFSNLEGLFQFRSEIGGVFFRFLKRCNSHFFFFFWFFHKTLLRR